MQSCRCFPLSPPTHRKEVEGELWSQGSVIESGSTCDTHVYADALLIRQAEMDAGADAGMKFADEKRDSEDACRAIRNEMKRAIKKSHWMMLMLLMLLFLIVACF